MVKSHKSFAEWHAAITWRRDEEKENELEELQALFKKCGGDKNYTAIPRAKFLKKFTQAVTVDGKPIVVSDVQALFNAGSIDYDFESFSLHEFMSLMIVLRGTDAEKKLDYMFKLYDKDISGQLSMEEVQKMLHALMATKAEVAREKIIEAFMEKFDKNKDGRVSKAELKRALEDSQWMEKYVKKGVTTLKVANMALNQQSRACLVM